MQLSNATPFTIAYFCLLYRQIIGISIKAFSTRLRLSHAMHAPTSVISFQKKQVSSLYIYLFLMFNVIYLSSKT